LQSLKRHTTPKSSNRRSYKFARSACKFFMKCAKPKFPDSRTKNLHENFCRTASRGSFHIWHWNCISVFLKLKWFRIEK
jgi:hypothetical protein